MRIGMIAPPWVPVPPTTYGGTEAIVDTLALGLQEAGHEVLLFATGDSTTAVPLGSVYARAPKVMGTTLQELRHVQAAYDAMADCDVIHDHTTVGPVWAMASDAGPPVVTTVHGPFNEEMRALYSSIGRWASVVAISHDQCASAPEVPFAAVIHHGIRPDRFVPGPGTGGYAFFVGRLAPEKGAREAVAMARRAGVPLRIAAKMREPRERRYFERWVEPALTAGDVDVQFLGEISPEERNAQLADAVALLNPISWPEPFGLVMIEALACGTPVVGYPSGAAPEIIDDGVTGYLVGSVDAGAEALMQIGDIDRAACRAVVETRFSAQRMVDEYVDLYERIAIGGSASRAAVSA